MPSFDVSCELDWSNLDNAIQQTLKEIGTRYDFKGIKVELSVDRKANTLTLWCSDQAKFSAFKELFENKVIKRGLSTLYFDYQKLEPAAGGSSRQIAKLQAGVSKEKGKEIVALVKDSKLKVQAQIQDEQVRVSGKNRDDLQQVIALLKSQQEKIKVPMQFGNFRE